MKIAHLLIISDLPLNGELLYNNLRYDSELYVTSPVNFNASLKNLIEEFDIHLIIFDNSCSTAHLENMLIQIRSLTRKIKTVIISRFYHEELVYLFYKLHANAFLSKESDFSLVQATIHRVLASRYFFAPQYAALHKNDNLYEFTSHDKDELKTLGLLSKREKEVISCYTMGYSSRQITDALSISLKTLQNHRNNIMTKYNLHEMSGLIRLGYILGYGSLHLT